MGDTFRSGNTDCRYCNGTGEIETENNGPAVLCPFCFQTNRIGDLFDPEKADKSSAMSLESFAGDLLQAARRIFHMFIPPGEIKFIFGYFLGAIVVWLFVTSIIGVLGVVFAWFVNFRFDLSLLNPANWEASVRLILALISAMVFTLTFVFTVPLYSETRSERDRTRKHYEHY